MGRMHGTLAVAMVVCGIVWAQEPDGVAPAVEPAPAGAPAAEAAAPPVTVAIAAPASPPFLTAADILAAPEPLDYAGMLEAHNFWRREVGTPDLQWSPQAAQMAQKWADTLAAEHCPMRHNLAPERKKVFGENIYRYWRTSAYEGFHRNPKHVVDAWGAESLWFDGASNVCRAPSGGTCGHYTQLVWNYSKVVGCGRAHCGDSEVWVCEYFPRGNFVGVRPFPHSSPEADAVFPMPSEEDVLEMMDGAPEQGDFAPAVTAAAANGTDAVASVDGTEARAAAGAVDVVAPAAPVPSAPESQGLH